MVSLIAIVKATIDQLESLATPGIEQMSERKVKVAGTLAAFPSVLEIIQSDFLSYVSHESWIHSIFPIRITRS